MIRSFIHNTVVSVVALAIAILTVFGVLAVNAQTSQASRRLAPNVAASRQPGEALGNTFAVSSSASAAVSFLPALSYPDGYMNSWLATGDLNGDGKQDVVLVGWCESSVKCTNYYPGVVRVLLGHGDGTFEAPAIYSTAGGQALSAAIGDLNGDGKPDLAVANSCLDVTCTTGGGVSVLIGKGDGSFQPAVIYYTAGSLSDSVAIGDVNGDGRPDLIVGNACTGLGTGCTSPGSVGVLLGYGDGTFQPATSYPNGIEGVDSLAVGDLNGDSHPDVVVITYTGDIGAMSVLLGNGDGTFRDPVSYSSGGYNPISIVINDVNGDGYADVFVADYCGDSFCLGSVSMFLANHDGTLKAPITYDLGVFYGKSVAIADVNGDGQLDIVAVGCGPNNATCENGEGLGYVGVLLGDGTGAFQPAVSFPGDGTGAFRLGIGDLNGDGKPDLVIAEFDTLMSVLLNDTGSSKGITTTALQSSANPSTYGQPVMFTAKVRSASGVPTGTILFYAGWTRLGSAALANGNASLSLSVMPAGSTKITAIYLGSTRFNNSFSGTLNQVVNVTATSTSVASSHNPAIPKQRIIFTATVTGQYGGPATGTIQFWDGSRRMDWGGISLVGNRATFTTVLGLGVHNITAVYSGDTNNNGSTSPVLTQSVAYASKTTVVTSGSPSFVGQPVTFTATVTSTFGQIPDGELVTFYDGTVALASVALTAGTAKHSTSALSVKAHSISAVYPADTTFGASTGRVTQLVLKYPTTTTVISSLNPSTYGQSVTFTAAVTSSGPYVVTGQVRFQDGTTGIGTAVLSGGVAKVTKSTLTAGAHYITASYLGDTTSGKSSSSAMSQVVHQASTISTITSSLNPSTHGQTVTFTAKVKSSTGAVVKGSVTFTAGANTLSTIALTSGVAKVSTSTLPAGSTKITAAYVGNMNFTGSSASLTQVVQ